ncbi:hypothetical protein E4T50_14148 [Aureobasidium sp. EXF-12298]|nr:hypothetical protein E4T50_14148 [Aureobasidium sp. EXF-12298]
MGKLHNRRRTRLRPNKKGRQQAIDIPSPSSSPIDRPNNSGEQYQIRHTQYYGAEEGDESGDLCPLMLQVVLDLFDGVDYEDP